MNSWITIVCATIAAVVSLIVQHYETALWAACAGVWAWIARP